MCERTCPACQSTDHLDLYGIIGAHLLCNECGAILAVRADVEAAPLDLTEDEAEAWALARRGVYPGAEANDPADDEHWRGPYFADAGRAADVTATVGAADPGRPQSPTQERDT